MRLVVSVICLILMVTAMIPETIAGSTRRRPSKTRTGLKIATGAALGAGVGALIGGGRGAASGALLGGGAMTAHSMARRDSGYGRGTRTFGTIASGTAMGTGLGAAVGGGKGAGIGALLGGGGSTLWALTRKDLKKPEYHTRNSSYQQRSYVSNNRSRSTKRKTTRTVSTRKVSNNCRC